MPVRITDGEIQPVRSPLGQSRLQAVVVRTGKIIYEVNILQPGEVADAAGVAIVRTVARSGRIWSTLIFVAETKQVTAVIADVADLQREVAGDGVLDIEDVIHDVGSFEIRIHRHEAARRDGRARDTARRQS